MSKHKFELGVEVKDTVTGFAGITVARTKYLTGCTHYSLQSRELKDGKPINWQSFDESQLVETGKEKTEIKEESGGPCPNPQKW